LLGEEGLFHARGRDAGAHLGSGDDIEFGGELTVTAPTEGL